MRRLRRQRELAAARAALDAKVYFGLDRTAVTADDESTLNAMVPVLQDHPELRIRTEGNADDRGSDEYNLALGQRRAATARRYLVGRGIDASRVDLASFGEERPTCRDENESCWPLNRRDEFAIVAGAERLAP